MGNFNWKSFFISFSIFYIIFFLILDPNAKKKEVNEKKDISIEVLKDEYVLGNFAQFKIENNSDEILTFNSPCESADNKENLVIFGPVNSISYFDQCSKNKTLKSFKVQPKQTYFLEFKEFSADIFNEEGKYKLHIKLNTESGEIKELKTYSFLYEKPGFFRNAFRHIVSYPLFNFLVFITNYLPGHSFGLAIIILTLVIRGFLFFPNQKAMTSQRKLQKLQPKMEELKKKYGKSQQMLAMKTMELYKREKINPMSSCLPMLIQMPFLLGLYHVIQGGISEHLRPMLWGIQSDANLTDINTQFLLWDLSDTPWNPENLWLLILPLIVGGAQFLAIKLTLTTNKKTTNKKTVTKKKDPESFSDGMADQMANMQSMMLWVMPAMIAFFTLTFPAGVGLYWFISTVFGVGQQKLVNYNLDKPQVRRKTD
jgi:YidC/Oxa1 family membrane protein insertase